MTQVQVHVAFGGTDVHAGTLFTHRRRGTESATFTYVTSYLAVPGAYALDPELPLAAGARQTRVGSALFGAMTDCAPDRWGRTLVIRRESALARAEGRVPRSLGEIDFLLGVRDDLRQGALRFRTDHGPFLADDDTGVPALTDLPALLDLAARASADSRRITRVRPQRSGAQSVMAPNSALPTLVWRAPVASGSSGSSAYAPGAAR